MKYFLLILLILIPVIGWCASSPSPSSLFNNINITTQEVNNVIRNGLESNVILFYMKIGLFGFGFFYVFRQMINYKQGQFNFDVLIINKLFFLMFVFWLANPTIWNYLISQYIILRSDLVKALGIAFIGDGGKDSTFQAIQMILMSLSFVTDALSILKIVAVVLFLLVLSFFFWTTMLSLFIKIILIYIFSSIGVSILSIFGFLMLPLMLVEELSFLSNGVLRGFAFMFVLSLVLKICSLLSMIYLGYGILGPAFKQFFVGGSFDLLGLYAYLSINGGISVVVSSAWDLAVIAVTVIFSLVLIGSSIDLTLFLLTGFARGGGGSAKASGASIKLAKNTLSGVKQYVGMA